MRTRLNTFTTANWQKPNRVFVPTHDKTSKSKQANIAQDREHISPPARLPSLIMDIIVCTLSTTHREAYTTTYEAAAAAAAARTPPKGFRMNSGGAIKIN